MLQSGSETSRKAPATRHAKPPQHAGSTLPARTKLMAHKLQTHEWHPSRWCLGTCIFCRAVCIFPKYRCEIEKRVSRRILPAVSGCVRARSQLSTFHLHALSPLVPWDSPLKTSTRNEDLALAAIDMQSRLRSLLHAVHEEYLRDADGGAARFRCWISAPREWPHRDQLGSCEG